MSVERKLKKLLLTKLCLIGFGALLIGGCGNDGDWICKKSKNANGQPVTYSQNTKTGDIGAASKACY